MCKIDHYDNDGNLIDNTQCEDFQGGILKQGLYTASVKFWDYITNLHIQFFNSNRGRLEQRKYFNDEYYDSIYHFELMLVKTAGDTLSKQLQNDIDTLYF